MKLYEFALEYGSLSQASLPGFEDHFDSLCARVYKTVSYLIMISGVLLFFIAAVNQTISMFMVLVFILNLSFWIPEKNLPTTLTALPLRVRCLTFTGITFVCATDFVLRNQIDNFALINVSLLITAHLLFVIQSPFFVSWDQSPLLILAACSACSTIESVYIIGFALESLASFAVNALLLVMHLVLGLSLRK